MRTLTLADQTFLAASMVAPGSSVIASDSFNRPDSTTTWGTSDAAEGGTPQAWTPISGTWGITSNTGYGAATTGDHQTYLESGHTDVDVRCTLFSLPGSSKNVGIIARMTDASNYYLAQVNSTGIMQLFKRVGGGYGSLAATVSGFLAGDELGLSCVGSTIQCLRNGVVVQTSTDGSLTSGTKVGVRTDVSGTWRIDRFKASSA